MVDKISILYIMHQCTKHNKTIMCIRKVNRFNVNFMTYKYITYIASIYNINHMLYVILLLCEEIWSLSHWKIKWRRNNFHLEPARKFHKEWQKWQETLN